MDAIRAPKSAWLETPVVVNDGKGYLMSREEFRDLALARTRIVSPDEFRDWNAEAFGEIPDELVAVASFIVHCDDSPMTIEETVCGASMQFLSRMNRVLVLEIVIDHGKFTVNGEDYTDLIKYTEEHEAFEAWLFVTERLEKAIRQSRARLWQYILAHRDGKADRMLQFYEQHARLLGVPLEREHPSSYSAAEMMVRGGLV